MQDTDHCFACGKSNPHGLRLEIRARPDGVELDFVADERYQGWHDITHGGIVATLLDELMTWACTSGGIRTVTAEMNVRFRRPLRVGEKVHGTGRIVRRRGRLVFAESRLLDRSGRAVAEASGKMMTA